MIRVRAPIVGMILCVGLLAAASRAQTIETGKKPFQARCAGCHGEDGTGGARGFNIVDARQPRATSKDAVRDLIRRGIPGGGMPAFSIPDGELDSIAAYVMSLRLTDPATPARSDPNARTTRAGTVETDAGIPFADIAQPKPGTWPTYHGHVSGNRFSPLDQINSSNVHHLAPRWMFTVHGTPRDLQMTPVVAGGVMYVTSVNEAYALDARSGREIWHYRWIV